MRIVVFNPYALPIVNPRSIRINNIINELKDFYEIVHICNPQANSEIHSTNRVEIGFKLSNNLFRNNTTRHYVRKIIKYITWPDLFFLNVIYQTIVYRIKLYKKDDVLLTISNPVSSHLANVVLKMLMIRTKNYWIADIGDLFNLSQGIKYWLFHKFENYVLNNSDVIVLNSEQMARHYIDKYKIRKDKLRIIENGSVLNFIGRASIFNQQLVFSYFGNSYEPVRKGIRELEILSSIVGSLEGIIGASKIQLIGQQHAALEKLFKNDPNVYFKPPVQPKDLLSEYQRTNILFCLANDHYPGLQSKLYEYTQSGLPIIYFCYNDKDPGAIYLTNYSPKIIVNLNQNDPKELFQFVIQHYHQGLNPKSSGPTELKWRKLLDDLNIFPVT